MKLHTLAFALLGCGLVAATACAPNPAKVCENFVSIMNAEGWELDTEGCLENMEDGSEDCQGDYNAFLRCILAAEDMDDLATCSAICEGDEEEAE